jgi:hypothetical protein
MPEFNIKWDEASKKTYETGVDRGVLYPYNAAAVDGATPYDAGYAWNGLTAFNKSPSGAEPTALWANNVKWMTLMSAEEFGATIEAYVYPDEFAKCLGYAEAEDAAGLSIGQQNRSMFGLCVRTLIGNEAKGNDYGYKLHLVYGCLASPSETSYATVNDSPEVDPMSFEITTTPVAVSGFKPTAYLCIDSTKADPTKLAALEAILYGSGETAAKLPLPDEVISTLKAAG